MDTLIIANLLHSKPVHKGARAEEAYYLSHRPRAVLALATFGAVASSINMLTRHFQLIDDTDLAGTIPHSRKG